MKDAPAATPTINSVSVRPSVPIDALRELVNERTRTGEKVMSVPDLLRWLDVHERLIDIALRVVDARTALVRGDTVDADNQLDRIEARLQHFVDLPWRS